MITPEIILRSAATPDGDFVFRVWKTSMKQYIEATWGWDEASQLQRQQAEFQEFADPHYQVIEIACQPIGTLILNRQPDQIYLSGLYLLPEYQHQGIGSRILHDLLSEAKASKLPLRLRVLNANLQARNWYDRLGFVVVDESDSAFTVMEVAA